MLNETHTIADGFLSVKRSLQSDAVWPKYVQGSDDIIYADLRGLPKEEVERQGKHLPNFVADFEGTEFYNLNYGESRFSRNFSPWEDRGAPVTGVVHADNLPVIDDDLSGLSKEELIEELDKDWERINGAVGAHGLALANRLTVIAGLLESKFNYGSTGPEGRDCPNVRYVLCESCHKGASIEAECSTLGALADAEERYVLDNSEEGYMDGPYCWRIINGTWESIGAEELSY